MKSPILFMVFNRPAVTKEVFNAIRDAQPPKLYIAADGAREDKVGEVERCKGVLDIVSKVDWPCEVKTLYREKNLGCKVAVSTAIAWFFEHEPEGIVLEDDCLPCMDFFRYCDEMLERYRDDQRIGAITGTNLYNLNYILKPSDEDNESYYFAKGPSVWGWASWRRVWKEYDVQIGDWEFLRESKSFQSTFSAKKWALLQRTFNSVYENKIDTWDYQFGFLLLKTNRLCVTSNVNLIENIGFNADGTHTRNSNSLEGHNKSCRIKWPLIHPVGIYPNMAKDNYIDAVYSSRLIRGFIFIFKSYNKWLN